MSEAFELEQQGEDVWRLSNPTNGKVAEVHRSQPLGFAEHFDVTGNGRAMTQHRTLDAAIETATEWLRDDVASTSEHETRIERATKDSEELEAIWEAERSADGATKARLEVEEEAVMEDFDRTLPPESDGKSRTE